MIGSPPQKFPRLNSVQPHYVQSLCYSHSLSLSIFYKIFKMKILSLLFSPIFRVSYNLHMVKLTPFRCHSMNFWLLDFYYCNSNIFFFIFSRRLNSSIKRKVTWHTLSLTMSISVIINKIHIKLLLIP